MREIKLRAWDKIDKAMRLPLGIWDIHLLAGEQEDYILMQYTDLKDKNGKEIYEGDIISYKRYRNEKTRKAKVSWGDCEWTLLNSEDKYVDGTSYIKSFFMFSESKQLEIIGNIYENRNLLNGK